jgi:hypothetical protein
MNLRSAVALVVALIVAFLLLARVMRPSRMTPSQTFTENGSSAGSPEKPAIGMPALPVHDWIGATAHTKKSDSERFVSLSRLKEDPDYVKGLIRRHVSIKSYLASPLKGDSQFEGLIDWLLGNGYAIEDAVAAWYALAMASSMQTIDDVREQMRRDGRSPEKIERSAEAILAASNRGTRSTVAVWLQLGEAEGDVLDSFLSLVPDHPFRAGNAERFMPSIQPVEGEAILHDEDWMSFERKSLVAAYRGLRRSTDPRDDWRPSPSPYSNLVPKDK